MNDNELQRYKGSFVKVTTRNGTPYCHVGKVKDITPEYLVLFPATIEERDLGEEARDRLRRLFRTNGWTGDAAFQSAFDDGHYHVKRADIARIDRF